MGFNFRDLLSRVQHQRRPAAEQKVLLLSPKNGKKPTQNDIDLALAVILLDVALSDDDLDPRELEFVKHALRDFAGQTDREVEELIESAHEARTSFRSSAGAVRTLATTLGKEERTEVYKMISQLVKIDGSVGEFESYLQKKFGSLLGIEEHA